MNKGMNNNIIAFYVRGDVEYPPRGYKEMMAQMILYVKLYYGFTRKARFIADVQKFDTPTLATYA